MLEITYPFIIIIGLTTLGVVFYFNLLLQRIFKILTLLLKLQVNNHLNVKDYINEMALHLKDIGIDDIVYKLSYSHSTIIRDNTLVQKNYLIKKSIEENLINGHIGIYVKSNRGEQKILNNLILYIINLQIINLIHSKIHTKDESFRKISQLQTYMMHDLKNILQFFQAMQYNVENIQTEEEKSRFIHYLQNNTEPVNRKVNNILALLKARSNVTRENFDENISLALIFQEYIDYYKLECKLNGDAKMFTDRENIQTIVDNILGNIHDKKLLEGDLKCEVTIKIIEDKIHLNINDSGSPFQNPLEVCEPFYTTKSQGIGIGMYQVASVVELLKGEMSCENINERPQITLMLPYKS